MSYYDFPPCEHDRDDVVPDVADSYALLDDGQVLAPLEPLYDDGDEEILNAARKRYRNLFHAGGYDRHDD